MQNLKTIAIDEAKVGSNRRQLPRNNPQIDSVWKTIFYEFDKKVYRMFLAYNGDFVEILATGAFGCLTGAHFRNGRARAGVHGLAEGLTWQVKEYGLTMSKGQGRMPILREQKLQGLPSLRITNHSNTNRVGGNWGVDGASRIFNSTCS